MRTLFKIIVMSCSLCVTKGAGVQVTNNTAIAVDTNVISRLSISQYGSQEVGSPPVCVVELVDRSTDSSVWSTWLPAERLFAIDLVDTNGLFVEKTDYGKRFDQQLTQKEVNDQFLPKRIAHGSMAAGFFAQSGSTPEAGTFSIPKAFKLTHAGEYTLHLRMRLIQTCVSDPSGTIRTNILDGQYFGPSRTAPTVFQSIWLPEVVAKVQIELDTSAIKRLRL